MSETSSSRRQFLRTGAAVAGASLLGDLALPITATAQAPAQQSAGRPVAPSDRVRVGVIGVGMQGAPLLRESINLRGVECAGACDVYDGRHLLAREIAGGSVPVTRRYQDILADKNVDAVIVAVPDHWHRQITLDALAAGKDVYCEKPMSHTPDDGVAMVDAARRSGRVVQVGSQRVSAPITNRARAMIKAGVLGDLTLVEATLGRNEPSGAWQYPPPPDLSPANLDWEAWQGRVPKRAFDPKLFASWRAYREYGTGVAGDLLVHLMSGMMHMLDVNAPPKRVMALGGIRRWKDGRNTPDVHAVLYEYEGLPPVYMRLNLGTYTPDSYRIQGAKGLIEVVGNTVTFTPQAGIDTSPSYYAMNSYPRAMREAYEKQWHQEHDLRVAREAMAETVTVRGQGIDALPIHLATFYDAVRTRKPVVEDAVFGHHAALSCHMANEAYYKQAPVTWDEGARRMRV